MTTGRGPMAAASTITISISPSWKLYDNPFFNHNPHHRHYRRRLFSHSPFSETTAAHHQQTMDSRIRELKAELERRLRKKAEAINKVLCKDVAEERRRREDAERDVDDLSEELGRARSEVERARAEVEEERKMMRVAEVLREERVQLKLLEAKFLVEEKLSGLSRKAGEDGPTKVLENPHIKRGIMGFVEFPRVVRTRACSAAGSAAGAGLPREGRGDAGPKLECQKAQLRVLLKNSRVIPVVVGRLGASGTESLVI